MFINGRIYWVIFSQNLNFLPEQKTVVEGLQTDMDDDNDDDANDDTENVDDRKFMIVQAYFDSVKWAQHSFNTHNKPTSTGSLTCHVD